MPRLGGCTTDKLLVAKFIGQSLATRGSGIESPAAIGRDGVRGLCYYGENSENGRRPGRNVETVLKYCLAILALESETGNASLFVHRSGAMDPVDP